MKTAPSTSLGTLFSPRSVAIIGASDDPDRLSGRPLRYLLEGGYRGAVYPINPNRTRVQGLPAFASLDALPEVPEVALIVTPAAAVRDAVAACARLGVRGIYLLAGGVAAPGEDPEAVQADLLPLARQAGMRILGPNCLGAFDARTRFFGTFATSLEGELPADGPIAIASQSGAYGQHLSCLVRRRGLPVRYLITTGNELDVELAECIEWLVHEPGVRVILAYAEGVRNGARLTAALAAARRAGKPVVFVKAGVSEAGTRAAATHTAALAGADAVYDAVFRQFGAYRAASTEEQVDLAYALVKAPALAGARLGIVSLSGGFGALAADAAERSGLQVPPLPDAAQRRLDGRLPLGGGVNPVDVSGQAVNDVGLLSDTLSVMCEAGNVDALIVCLTTTPLAAALETPIRAAIAAGTGGFRASHPVVVQMIADPGTVAAYEQAGFLVFEDLARAVTALGALAAFQRAFEGRQVDSPAVPGETLPQLAIPEGALSEVASKALLRQAGVPCLDETLAGDAAHAVAAAEAAGGPVALKIVSPDILHKTEVGGVVLGVQGRAAVAQAYESLLQRVREAQPAARIEGVLVSPMVGEGVEIILGVVRDPTFGPVVMAGLGGVFAECFRDMSFRVAPIDADEARRMLHETRAATLLEGWRGGAAADVAALVETIVRLSRFAAAHGETLEGVDINPLVVRAAGQGCVALDAVVVGGRQ